jgi:hypothetical protein
MKSKNKKKSQWKKKKTSEKKNSTGNTIKNSSLESHTNEIEVPSLGFKKSTKTKKNKKRD